TPADAEALYELGSAYEGMGRGSDAARALESAGKVAKSQEIADKLAEGLGRLRVGSQQQVP
ncbi:MAG TPA: hypothetical protein VK651_02650, partial [Blastocatellia bacterium]|nr:hypothetical protein [Blastocatellia bacterium]